MKVTEKQSGDNVAAGLAKRACACESEHRVIVAADARLDTKDEAQQSAIAYWMMGWAWDEIESVLEDSEYAKDIVQHALKNAKDHAREVLNKGPFSLMRDGQLVKLIDGSIGVLLQRFADHINVHTKDGLVKINKTQIDRGDTTQLTNAYDLRKQAHTLLLDIQDALPFNKEAHIDVLEPRPYIIHTINSLETTQQLATSTCVTASEIYNEWKESNNYEKSDVTSEAELKFAQYFAATLSQEKQINEELQEIHAALRNRLSMLKNALATACLELEDEAVLTFLDSHFPRLVRTFENHISALHKVNIYTHECFKNFGKSSSDWRVKVLAWAKDRWAQTQAFADQWETELAPMLTAGVLAIDNLLKNIDDQYAVNRIDHVLNQV
jgi:hypothetical protein